MNYKSYLHTKHWREIRKKKLLKTPICQVCNNQTGLHVHHKKYKYKGKSILFKERVEDLITLCNSCHRLIHIYFGTSMKKINKKILRVRRLMELKAIKKMAFLCASNDDLFITVRNKLLACQTIERFFL